MRGALFVRGLSDKVISERYRVLNPLQDARARAQWYDLVGSHVQPALAALLVLAQQHAHHREHLLHHGVLAQVVAALDELLVADAIASDAHDDLGHVDATHERELALEAVNLGRRSSRVRRNRCREHCHVLLVSKCSHRAWQSDLGAQSSCALVLAHVKVGEQHILAYYLPHLRDDAANLFELFQSL